MNMGKSTDYESILRMADMNTLEHRRIEQSLMIFFKCFKENDPGYVSNLFKPRVTPYNLRSNGLKPNSNRNKRVELWVKSINFVNLGCHFPCASSAKSPRNMYARVPQAMAQFVLKIKKLSQIMGPTPILEMARTYGLRPRLWLLLISYNWTIIKRNYHLIDCA